MYTLELLSCHTLIPIMLWTSAFILSYLQSSNPITLSVTITPHPASPLAYSAFSPRAFSLFASVQLPPWDTTSSVVLLGGDLLGADVLGVHRSPPSLPDILSPSNVIQYLDSCVFHSTMPSSFSLQSLDFIYWRLCDPTADHSHKISGYHPGI